MDMEKKYRVALVSPNLGDHMTVKLAHSLAKVSRVGEVFVAGVDRGKGSVNPFYRRLAGFPSGGFFSRAFKLLSLFFKIRKAVKPFDVVAAWSLDTSLLALSASKFFGAKNKKFIYFYSDVHPVCTRKTAVGALARAVECFIARHADIVAFTSPLFRTEYFGRMCGLEIKNFQYVENKIAPDFAEKSLAGYNPDSRDFSRPTIGYFGILPYKDAYDFMCAAARSGVRTYFRGKLLPSVAENFPPEVENGGAYKNPDDFPEMYAHVNMSYIIHNFAPDTNYQWQMTNRFYDALMMKTPLVVQKGTSCEKFVRDNDIGVVVDIYNPEESVGVLSSISHSDLERWVANISKLDKSTWQLGDEYERMFGKILPARARADG